MADKDAPASSVDVVRGAPWPSATGWPRAWRCGDGRRRRSPWDGGGLLAALGRLRLGGGVVIGMFPLFYRFQLPGRDPTYGYHGLWARSQMGIVRLPLDSSVLLLFLGSFSS